MLSTLNILLKDRSPFICDQAFAFPSDIIAFASIDNGAKLVTTVVRQAQATRLVQRPHRFLKALIPVFTSDASPLLFPVSHACGYAPKSVPETNFGQPAQVESMPSVAKGGKPQVTFVEQKRVSSETAAEQAATDYRTQCGASF